MESCGARWSALAKIRFGIATLKDHGCHKVDDVREPPYTAFTDVLPDGADEPTPPESAGVSSSRKFSQT